MEELRRRLRAGRALRLALARDIGQLQIQTDHSYHGKHEHLWGRFTFHGRPVFGTKWTLQGVPPDRLGRNIYVDYLDGPAWRRVNSFLTHPPTAGFCYTFANHPAASPAWNGQGTATPIARRRSARCLAARATHFAPPGSYSPASDTAANAAQKELLGGDSRCRID